MKPDWPGFSSQLPAPDKQESFMVNKEKVPWLSQATMASTNRSTASNELDPIGKLNKDANVLRQEAHNMEQVAQAQEGETEQRMKALLLDNLQYPATINSIEVHGAKNTRKGFLDPVFKPLVDDSHNAGTTLGDVLSGLREATDKLNGFDIFHPEPRVTLSDARASDPHAAATDLDIAISVREKSRLIFKAGTDVGNAEGSAYTNALWRNMFGGGETLSVNASAGTRTRSAYSASFSTPVNSNPDLRFSLEGLASSTQKPWASHEEVLKGGSARLAWLARMSSGAVDTHTVSYLQAWRQLTGLAENASPTVRADAGDSVKCSVSHTFTRDRRDSPMLPQNGYLLRATSELAGWGPLQGDVSFAKYEVEASGAKPLSIPGTSNGPSGISVGGGLRLGLMYPLPFGYSLSGTAVPSRVNDRFQLGGPTDVRGFTQGGLGPRHGPDAVGGDVYAAGGINMLLPLPRTGPASPLRLQLFANGGRLVAVKNLSSTSKDGSYGLAMDSKIILNGMKSAIGELSNGLPSMAAGVGLVYAHPAARFELNFSLPLVSRKGEEGRKGLQVGVGINFL